MYIVGFPLLLIPLAIYNIIAFLFNLGFKDTLFSVHMMSGVDLGVTTSDLLLILSILLLFVEILKATRFGVKSIIDHILSFVVFVVALGEFLMVKQAATSTFLLLLVICIVDVVGGFSISIRAATRDYNVEGSTPLPALTDPFPVMTRDFHAPGRSPVYAGNGMVATSHPLASLAAIETLRAGGNAADAAVAAIAIAGVVEPQMTGIGGDCFCLVAKPGQPIWGYNGSGRSAAAMRAELLIEQGLTEIATHSVHSVTVPGAVEAWEMMLKAHGRFGIDRALSFAIDAAERGVPVPPRVQYDWSLAQGKLAADPVTAAIYLPGGAVPAVGDVVRFPALAKTLRTIAKGGARAFYEGAIADDMVATLAARGGLLTSEDFAAHRGEEAPPLESRYRDLDVVELPPNGQGVAALLLLNMLERFDMASLDPVGADRLHLLIEAGRLAYAVRNLYVADPAFMQVPVLLDRSFAAELAGLIDLTRRSNFPKLPKPQSSTVLCCVVDRDRNAVTIINSLFSTFGSGIATEKSGILLHHRGSGFNLDPASPNCIGPSKRPLHTIIPALTKRDGRVDMAFGVMGGAYQAMGHAHFISNLVDHGMDLQTAIDLPRVFFEGEPLVAESGVSEAVMQDLRARGHDAVRRPVPLGGAQAIRIDWDRGVLIGGSDARKDGCALGY